MPRSRQSITAASTDATDPPITSKTIKNRKHSITAPVDEPVKTIEKRKKSKTKTVESVDASTQITSTQTSKKDKRKKSIETNKSSSTTTTTPPPPICENDPNIVSLEYVAAAKIKQTKKKNRHAIEAETIQNQLQHTDVVQIIQELQPTLDAHSFSDAFSVKPEFRRIKQSELQLENKTNKVNYALTYRPFTDVIVKKIAARHGVTRLSVAARVKLRELAVLLTSGLVDVVGEQLVMCKKMIVSRQHAQSAVEQELKMRVLGLSV